MWYAMGNCYETLDKPMYKVKAVQCYERAELEGDDGNARSRLASSELAAYGGSAGLSDPWQIRRMDD